MAARDHLLLSHTRPQQLIHKFTEGGTKEDSVEMLVKDVTKCEFICSSTTVENNKGEQSLDAIHPYEGHPSKLLAAVYIVFYYSQILCNCFCHFSHLTFTVVLARIVIGTCV